MSRFKEALDAFMRTASDWPAWDRHIPDSIYAHIETLDDFTAFLAFINTHLRTHFIEYGCEDTEEFLRRMEDLHSDDDAQAIYLKHNITTDLGKLAYRIVIAMAN